MKRMLIKFVVIVLALIGIFVTTWWGFDLRKVYYGDLTASFANDLGDFVESHDGQLPKDWTEFELWQTARDGKIRWQAEESAARFLLLTPPYRFVNEIPQYVRVVDPDLDGMEDYVNRRIESSVLERRRARKGGRP